MSKEYYMFTFKFVPRQSLAEQSVQKARISDFQFRMDGKQNLVIGRKYFLRDEARETVMIGEEDAFQVQFKQAI